MDEGVLAAVRRFPERRRAIEALAAGDEGFRSLCVDLADAEAALAGWRASTAAVRDARCAEYRDLVEDLAREVGTALGTGRPDDRS
jgi:hypothetical protein